MRHTLTPREHVALDTLTTVDGFRATIEDMLAVLSEHCADRDYHPILVYGARTAEEQDRLYAQGRTAPGPKVTNARAGESAHNYAAAADIAFVFDKGGTWLPADHEAWTYLATLIKAGGLMPGPRWDHAHMEMRGWSARARLGSLKLWHGAPQ